MARVHICFSETDKRKFTLKKVNSAVNVLKLDLF